jgi:hypothetical protein
MEVSGHLRSRLLDPRGKSPPVLNEYERRLEAGCDTTVNRKVPVAAAAVAVAGGIQV